MPGALVPHGRNVSLSTKKIRKLLHVFSINLGKPSLIYSMEKFKRSLRSLRRPGTEVQ